MNDLNLIDLREGDIFHVECDNGARLICIVNEVAENHIISSVITTQECITFDRHSGANLADRFKSRCIVNQTKRLPPDLDRIMRQIDRKYRLGNAPEGFRLLPEEISGMMMIDDFYEQRQSKSEFE